jgi:glycosyltransferase involved in cell wall biosynthesis
VQPRSLLFVSLMNGAPWGGSEELWYRTAMQAAGESHEIGCVVYRWEERRPRLDALRAAGARVFELPNAGRAKHTLADTLRFEAWTRLRRRAALASVPFEAYDCAVLNQGGWQDLAASEWNRVRERLHRYAILFHNYDGAMSISGRRLDRLAAWTAGASANLFAAEAIRETLERKLGRAVPNPAVFQNPVAFAPPPRPIPRPPGPPWRFAVLAALDVRRKAQDALLQVLGGPEWKERPFELSLFGSGPDERLLARLIRQRGLSGRVRLEGHTSDVAGAIAGAHVILQLTRIDAMPITVVEAMAVGRPVAVTRVGDMPGWVREGENGWIAADARPAAIAKTLEQVWASRDRWGEMGERAHRLFRERHPVPSERRLLDALLAT